jgi:hypothetical protein
MSRPFIAAILATSLAITSFAAAPARAANNEDLAKFLFGATALVIIGKALSDNDRNKANHSETRPRPRPYNKKELPRRCLTRAETAVGEARVYRAKCLNRHYSRADRLPQACRLPIWTHKGRKPGYLARCLRDRGYTPSPRQNSHSNY